MELFTYYRSTSSFRVRIALALKGLDYQALPVNLIAPAGGEHRQAPYLGINPQGRVPALRTDEGDLLIQSPAILEYLTTRNVIHRCRCWPPIWSLARMSAGSRR